MSADRQGTTVERTPEGQVRIHYDWLTASGLQMGGQFVVECAVAGWLADRLSEAAEDRLVQIDGDFPPDHLRVYIAGGHRYDDINVNAINHREPESPYGKLYALSGMARDIALTLASQLRDCVGSEG